MAGMTSDLSAVRGQLKVASPGVAWCVVRSGLRDASCMMRMGPGRWESQVGKNREDSPFNAEDTPKTARKSPELRHFTPCYGFAIRGAPQSRGEFPVSGSKFQVEPKGGRKRTKERFRPV